MNPYVKDTRTSNVPVCLFQHTRILLFILFQKVMNPLAEEHLYYTTMSFKCQSFFQIKTQNIIKNLLLTESCLPIIILRDFGRKPKRKGRNFSIFSRAVKLFQSNTYAGRYMVFEKTYAFLFHFAAPLKQQIHFQEDNQI